MYHGQGIERNPWCSQNDPGLRSIYEHIKMTICVEIKLQIAKCWVFLPWMLAIHKSIVIVVKIETLDLNEMKSILFIILQDLVQILHGNWWKIVENPSKVTFASRYSWQTLKMGQRMSFSRIHFDQNEN